MTIRSGPNLGRAVRCRRFPRDLFFGRCGCAAGAFSNRSASDRVVARTEVHVRLVLIVCSATQRDVVDGWLAAVTVRMHVMPLEEAALGAALPVGAREGAPPAVAFPHRSPHRSRDVPRPAPRRLGSARAVGLAQTRSLQVRNEHRQRPIEDGSRISGGNLVAHEILCPAQPGMHLGARRELDLVELWG
jgi:hypothetical protein